MSSSPPSHARPSHNITTPRRIFRSSIPSDAKPFALIRSDPLNNPHGGVHDPDLPIEVQADQLSAQKASTAQGENAFMNIISKLAADQRVDELVVDDGILIGMTGFNSFPTAPSSSDPETVLLVGDTGAMIDHRFARKGLALEALQAVFEYRFAEVGCGMMSLDTSAENVPFRNLMSCMGLADVETVRRGVEGPMGEEALYRFERTKWEVAKRGVKERGKWYM